MSGFITSKGANYLMALAGGATSPYSNYYLGLTNRVPAPYEYYYEVGEIPSYSYDRVAIPSDGRYWTLSGTTISNLMELAFPVASESWGDIYGWVLFTAAEAGDILFGGDLAVPWTVDEGWQAVMGPGMLSIHLPVSEWELSL